MALVVCAGWDSPEEHHPCEKVIGQTEGSKASHGVCPDCFRHQLEGTYSPEYIRQLLERVYPSGKGEQSATT